MKTKKAVVIFAGIVFIFSYCFIVWPHANIDTLISGGIVVTMNGTMDVIEDGAVAVKNGKIIAVGKDSDIRARFKANVVVNTSGKIVMPGLVNTHTHAAMVLLRGYADDLPLRTWLEGHMWPAEEKYINRESVRAAARLAIAEMIRSGTTTFSDMYFFEDEVAQAAKEAHMRVVVGEGLNGPTPHCRTPEEGLEYTQRLIKKYQGDRLVTVAVAPHSAYTCSPELLKKAADLSKKYNVPLHIHLAETKDEVATIKSKYGVRPVAYLDNLGLLTERTVAAHAIQITDEEIQLLGARKTGVAHNAQSNMKLAEGIAPVPQMLSAKVKVGLGTDGAASNNDLNMFEEMQTVALLHKLNTGSATALDARTVLRLATINGAEVLGLQDTIGSLEEGKEADIVILDTDRPHLTPHYDVYSLLVYSADGSDVDTVMIAGRIVMRNRKLLTINEKKAIADVKALAEHIKRYNTGATNTK